MPDQGPAQPEQTRVTAEQQPKSEQASTPEAPEVEIEQQAERSVPEQEPIDAHIDTLRGKLRKPKKQKPSKIPQVRDELTIQVEQIMSEGLGDAFTELTPVEQQEFKLAGERTAMQIRNLLRGSRVKVKKIFQLVVEWLKKLPGINRFYLMQEAKIKTDKIVSLSDKHKYQ